MAAPVHWPKIISGFGTKPLIADVVEIITGNIPCPPTHHTHDAGRIRLAGSPPVAATVPGSRVDVVVIVAAGGHLTATTGRGPATHASRSMSARSQ